MSFDTHEKLKGSYITWGDDDQFKFFNLTEDICDKIRGQYAVLGLLGASVPFLQNVAYYRKLKQLTYVAKPVWGEYGVSNWEDSHVDFIFVANNKEVGELLGNLYNTFQLWVDYTLSKNTGNLLNLDLDLLFDRGVTFADFSKSLDSFQEWQIPLRFRLGIDLSNDKKAKGFKPKSELPSFECVYFLQQGNTIKIGYTKSIADRIKTLQTASPIPLTLLATLRGDRKLESYFHTRFASYRLEGEWFSLEGTLLDYLTEDLGLCIL